MKKKKESRRVRELVCKVDVYLIDAPRHFEPTAIQAAIGRMPAAQLATVKYLFEHLRRVCAQSASNMMTPVNLAVCFAPSLMRQTVDTSVGGAAAIKMAQQALASAEFENKVIQTLLEKPHIITDCAGNRYTPVDTFVGHVTRATIDRRLPAKMFKKWV